MKPLSEEDLLEATKDLVSIESTTENPAGLKKAYEYIRRMLINSGANITIEEFESGGRPSLLAYHSGQRPDKFHIILNGHLDVVPGKPEQYKAFVEEGKLYGRGVVDMKAACVILTDMFCQFVDKVPYALGLQIVTDEESAGHDGTLYQIQQGVRSDFVICGECGRATDTYEIANEAKGIIAATVGFHGKSAHGAYPWNGDNAALKAARFTHLLHERFPVPLEATSETTFAVTGISADSGAHTTTPDKATVKVNARFVAGDPHFESPAHFATLMKEIDPSAEVLEFHDFSSPIYTDPANPLLQSLKASAEKVEGHEFTLVRRNGTSDGRFFGDVGNEACEFGIAGEGQHSQDEYITLEAFRNFHAALSDFLEKTIQGEQGSDRQLPFRG